MMQELMSKCAHCGVRWVDRQERGAEEESLSEDLGGFVVQDSCMHLH
jgi:hypothetical protein